MPYLYNQVLGFCFEVFLRDGKESGSIASEDFFSMLGTAEPRYPLQINGKHLPLTKSLDLLVDDPRAIHKNDIILAYI